MSDRRVKAKIPDARAQVDDPASAASLLEKLAARTPETQAGMRTLFSSLRDQIMSMASQQEEAAARRSELEAMLRRAMRRARPNWRRRLGFSAVFLLSIFLNVYFVTMAARMGDVWSEIEYDLNRAATAAIAMALGEERDAPARPVPDRSSGLVPEAPAAAEASSGAGDQAATPDPVADPTAALQTALDAARAENVTLRREVAALKSRAQALDRKLKAQVAATTVTPAAPPASATAQPSDVQRAIAERAVERARALREGPGAHVLDRVASAPRIRYVYVVQPGDTLDSIGMRFGVSVPLLLNVNQTRADIQDGQLNVGDRINIPG